MKQFIIKKANPKDLEKIYQIEVEVQIEPWSKFSLKEAIEEDKNTLFWCIYKKKSQKIVGYICFRILIDELYILNLSVEQKAQNIGIGTFVLKCLYKFALNKSIKRIVLDVHKRNKQAIVFYKKRGFKIAGAPNDFRGKHFIMEMKLSK